MPLVAFNSIECDLPDIDPTNLSYDQKYLLDICTAISSSDVAKHQPGTSNLALWLSNNCKMNFDALSINIKPIKRVDNFGCIHSKSLRTLMFRIEVHHSIKNVARHLWHFISSSRSIVI
ncbi:hypothetical protein AVEN_122704-1 [Araneus ventricosus]|uniref:Uncharacterized protein n=1 Tax=Araneus ventricosus TaxID=182803 RepID=A0A4Y2SRT1_ARAVE|nr:hypothetical protein AVEN_122704-1 [Araneus ventricosus]